MLIPHGAGASNFLRQLGGAFGINLISLAMQRQTSAHREALNATQSFYRDMFLLIGAVFALTLVPAAFIAGRRRYAPGAGA